MSELAVVAESVERMLRYARRIAVVGLSPRPLRPSFGVAASMVSMGYEIVPVNPNLTEWEGLRAYARLEDVPGVVDIVDVFRRAEHAPDIAAAAVQIGARGLWLQQGVVSMAAKKIATAAGLDYVEDRCLRVEIAVHGDLMRLPPSA